MATTIGRRRESATIPDTATAWAASGTTSTVEDRPSAPTRPGSSRSIAAVAANGGDGTARRGAATGPVAAWGDVSVTPRTYPG
jgi:hypothetical protein